MDGRAKGNNKGRQAEAFLDEYGGQTLGVSESDGLEDHLLAQHLSGALGQVRSPDVLVDLLAQRAGVDTEVLGNLVPGLTCFDPCPRSAQFGERP